MFRGKIMETIPEKYTLNKKHEEILQLKIFYMLAMPNTGAHLLQQFKIRNVGVMAYDSNKARIKASEVWGENGAVSIISSDQDFTLVEDLLKAVDIKGIKLPKPEKPMGIEAFKNSLAMACNEYIKSAKDKAILNRIINDIPTPTKNNKGK